MAIQEKLRQNMKIPAVYIMASKKNGTLYTRVTADLARRVWEHKNGFMDGFSKKYDCKIFVFYEIHNTMEFAIIRETQLKKGSRKKKVQLIECMNPEWKDLYETVV